ncbi:MAG: hypothetical protein FWD39_03635 [Clostridiales bacterium]|nr:hypothetical protein [Clostridiales bacterium]
MIELILYVGPSMTKLAPISWVSLAIGLVLGFLAQRSRMCFIGGWRDYFLVKDTYLLKGFFAFFAAAIFFFFVFFMAGYKDTMAEYPRFLQPAPEYTAEYLLDKYGGNEGITIIDFENKNICTMPQTSIGWGPKGSVIIPIRGIHIFGIIIPNEVIITLLAALGIGLFSTLANGCPLRQHVMASSGNASAMLYLLGFYVAIVVYDNWLVKFVNNFVNWYIEWGVNT